MTVRAFYRAAKVENAQPPYDTIHFKVIYPAKISGSKLESNLEIVPADEQQAPLLQLSVLLIALFRKREITAIWY